MLQTFPFDNMWSFFLACGIISQYQRKSARLRICFVVSLVPFFRRNNLWGGVLLIARYYKHLMFYCRISGLNFRSRCVKLDGEVLKIIIGTLLIGVAFSNGQRWNILKRYCCFPVSADDFNAVMWVWKLVFPWFFMLSCFPPHVRVRAWGTPRYCFPCL